MGNVLRSVGLHGEKGGEKERQKLRTVVFYTLPRCTETAADGSQNEPSPHQGF